MHDLAIVIISTNEAHWLRPCLSSIFEHAGRISLDVIVADNMSTDGTRELVESEFPAARVVTCENHGFGHANNRATMESDARWVLFLNPDTETVDGTYEDLVRLGDQRPEIGLIGVRQIHPNGVPHPSIHHFPNALRALGEAVGSDRLPWGGRRWLTERETDRTAYDREVECDWISGSFMLVRREAIESAGFMDERFFIYSEETDFCLRIRQAGWRIVHVPSMTIVHHANKTGVKPRPESQLAYAKMQYARKHFSPLHRIAYWAALALRYGIRLVLARGRDTGERREAYMAVLKTLIGRRRAPYEEPPPVAVRPRQR